MSPERAPQQNWFMVAAGAALLLAATAIALSLLVRCSPTPSEPPIGQPKKKDVVIPPDITLGKPTDKPPVITIPVSQIGLSQSTLAGKMLEIGATSPGGAGTHLRYLGSGLDVIVDFEVKPVDAPFDGAALRSLPPDPKGWASFRHQLAPGAYHWQARVRRDGAESAWHSLAAAASPHFVVVPPPPVPAPKDSPRNAEGPGAPESMSSSGAGGTRRPNASEPDRLAPLWSKLLPAALALIAHAVVAGGIGLWRSRARSAQ